MKLRRLRPWAVLLVVFTALAFMATDVDARIGGGRSFGSRGARTYSPPPLTRTAPNTAAPFQRSITQPGQIGTARPATSPFGGGFFRRPGFLGGIFAGFLGAGLFGMLFGHGLFGGLGGFGSIIGLLLQLAVIAFVGRLIWNWWQRRNEPAYATAGEPQSYGYAPSDYGQPMGGSSAAGEEIAVQKEDYDAFERLLIDTQLAYSREDLAALRQRVTPEMLNYFSEDLTDNSSRGVVNRLSDVKLLQGDLAEAWREGDVEYATVAMTFSLIDTMVDRASGRVVDGDPTQPVTATELWTFRRAVGGQWLLSAIQQS